MGPLSGGRCYHNREDGVDNRSDLWRYVDVNKERLIALSDLIWEMPELLYQEIRSVAEHTAELEHRLCRQELHRLLPSPLLKL